jgi:DNA polymerase III epsilon subunit-like protein
MPKAPANTNKLIQALLKRTPLSVLDVETSGWMEDILESGATHKGVVLQIGGVGVTGKTINKFETLVNPAGQGVKINKEWLEAYKKSEAYTSLHGIGTPFPGYTGKLASVKEVQQKLSGLFGPESKGLLLGYNLKKFDLPFLQERIGWSPTLQQQHQIIDVMQLAKKSIPGLKSYALPDVAKMLGIKVPTGLHQSLTDSILTLAVFRDKRISGDSSIGNVLKMLHDIPDINRLNQQIKFDKMQSEYRKARIAAGELPYGGIGTPKSHLGDIDFSLETSQGEAERAQADVNYLREKMHAESRQELLDYYKNRAIEESVFMGAHSPETLALAKKRIPFWEQVSPRNMRREFIMENLGFTESQADLLMGGKYPKGNLRKVFAAKMAEFEITGHLPGRMSKLASSRIVSFGAFASEPGALFSGMLPSGKSAYITPEQQRGFMEHVFGVTKSYRMAGTGELVTPEQMSKIKVVAPAEDIAALNQYGTKAKFRTYLESEISKERKLAKRERKGWVDLERATQVNPYEYNIGKPGRRKPNLKVEDEEMFFERMIREATEGAPAEDINLVGESVAAGTRSMEAIEGDIKGLTGKTEAEREKLLQAAEQLTGQAEIELGAGVGAENLESAAAKTNLYSTVGDTVSYIENTSWHQRRLSQLKDYYNKAFITEWIEAKGKSGKAIKEKVFTGYSEEFKKGFAKSMTSAKAMELSLAGKSREEIEEILGIVRKGSTIKVKIDGKWQTIVEEDADKLSQIYLQGTAESSSMLFSSLKNEIPVRAQAEQVLEIFFRKSKKKAGYEAYTAAGTLIGETSKKTVPPKAYAKIFEWKGKYRVGWAPTATPFYASRYGTVEQAIGGMPEVNSLLDLDDAYRLRYNADVQDKLKKMYDQTGEDYKLIAKYKFDRTQKAFVDIETGQAVDEAIAKTYFTKIEKTYERHAKAVQRQKFSRATRTLDLTAGKATEQVFGGRLPKGKNMLYAALSVSAALVALTAFSSRRRIMSPKDVPREAYGSNTDDERMFNGRPAVQNRANITPEYSGPMGYRTNIDVHTTDSTGVDPRNLSEVMNRHASNTLRTSKGSVHMEINDNSDRATSYQLQNRYSNMLRA